MREDFCIVSQSCTLENLGGLLSMGKSLIDGVQMASS